MTAITIKDEGAAPVPSDVPSPTLEASQVLVRVRASSVNPIDAAIAAGMLKGMVEHEYPITLGRDFAGTVQAVVEGVTSLAAGDEVFGAIPAGWPTVHAGAWAEQIAVYEINVAKRPSSVDVAIAGVAGFAPTTALAAVDAIAPQTGDVVLDVGATGGVGSVVVQLIHAAGATVVAPSLPEDEGYLRDLGVGDLVPRDGDATAAVRER